MLTYPFASVEENLVQEDVEVGAVHRVIHLDSQLVERHYVAHTIQDIVQYRVIGIVFI